VEDNSTEILIAQGHKTALLARVRNELLYDE